jgi:hypothetical protein
MSTVFGWWVRDPELGKFQVRAVVHGGSLKWLRKQGHHSTWLAHTPTESDWEQLMGEAGRRVPRRLLSPKQFEEIKRMREQA